MPDWLQIIGWHPRWEKIQSIKVIREETQCSLAEAKRIIDLALQDKHPRVDVPGDRARAHRLAKSLADKGAIVLYGGRKLDSFLDEEEGVPYRKQAIATVLVIAEGVNQVSARIIRGEPPREFIISLPLNGGLDARAAGRMLQRDGDVVLVGFDAFEDSDLSLFLGQLLGEELDLHPRWQVTD